MVEASRWVKVLHDHHTGGAMKGKVGKVVNVWSPLPNKVYVKFPSGTVLPFPPDAVTPVDVRIIEGVVNDDLGFLTIGGEYIGLPFRDLKGKNVHVAIVVREGE